MTEEVTATLSRIASLFVIARTSAFAYKGKGIKVQDISRELGVHYVLEGSVRKADGQIRIIAQLIDAMTGGQLKILFGKICHFAPHFASFSIFEMTSMSMHRNNSMSKP